MRAFVKQWSLHLMQQMIELKQRADTPSVLDRLADGEVIDMTVYDPCSGMVVPIPVPMTRSRSSDDIIWRVLPVKYIIHYRMYYNVVTELHALAYITLATLM